MGVKYRMANKKESNPYIARCQKCGSKTVLNLRRVNKTATSFKPCNECSRKGETHDIHNTLTKSGKEKKTIHRIIGKVTRIKKNSLKIQWFR